MDPAGGLSFTVSPEVYALADERVQKLRKGEITQVEFSRLMRQDDPWEVRDGVLRIVTEEEMVRRRNSYREGLRKRLVNTGGLTGSKIYNAREQVLKCYPEMAASIKKAEDAIALKKCKGCALNAEAAFLVQELLALPVDKTRDLSLLEGVFPPAAISRLKNEPVVVSDNDLAIPPSMFKREIPRLPAETLGMLQSFRQPCANCCRKHLGQAVVLLGESLMGYPQHRWLAVGHLAEASEEIFGLYPEIAISIREERLQTINDSRYVPQLMHYFDEIEQLEARRGK
jgi:hypothetical protein